MTTPVDIDKLKERLLATEHRGQFAMGGGVLGQDGTCETWGGEKIMVARNPDGAAAVQAIDALIAKAERVDALERALQAVEQFSDQDIPAIDRVAGMRSLARNALSPTTMEDQHG